MKFIFAAFFFSILLSAGAQKSSKPVYVIVHGAWGGGWAFKKTDSLLRETGAIVYRPTLTGQGEKVHLANDDIRLQTHILDVVNMILFEELHDIILVGHSYGGMVITGVADSLPSRIKKIIYLDAFVPENGESLVSIQGRRADWIKQMTKGEFVVPAWIGAGQKRPTDVPHPLKTFTDPLVLKNSQRTKIPATYILTVSKGTDPAKDDFATQGARARSKGWPVLQLEADHNPQWSAPEALVALLEKIRKN